MSKPPAALAGVVCFLAYAATAAGQANFNPPESLCLQLRAAGSTNAQGECMAADSECGPVPDGILQCTDDDLDPLNGSICVDQACYLPGTEIVVDIEIGPTAELVCGAQVFMVWDVGSLIFLNAEADPDGEFAHNNPGLTFVLAFEKDFDAGTIDLAIALPIDIPCDGDNGTLDGGTIARLTFEAIGICKSGGVAFRPHNPPSFASGPSGSMPMVGCNGEANPSSTDEYTIQARPQWNCPAAVESGFADCGKQTREVLFDPLLLASCDLDTPLLDELCTIEYFPLCEENADCPAGQCAGNYCDAPFDPPGVDLTELLPSGGDFLPGRTVIRCNYVDSCGLDGACEIVVENLGQSPDSDADGIPDACDNCPTQPNTEQLDCDEDGIGDVCAIVFGLSDDCNSNGVPDECENFIPTVSSTGMAWLCAFLVLGIGLATSRQFPRPGRSRR